MNNKEKFNPSVERTEQKKQWERQQAPMKRFKRPAYKDLNIGGKK